MHQIFLGVLRARLWIVAVFVLLTAAGIYGALKIPTDSAIDRLIVPGDPISQATDEFEKVFPEGEQALLMLESPDPLSLGSLRSAADLERQLAKIPHVEPHSLLTLFSRGNSGKGDITASQADQIRKFATGTQLFRRAGLLGDHYLGIAVELRVKSPEERDAALAGIDA